MALCIILSVDLVDQSGPLVQDALSQSLHRGHLGYAFSIVLNYLAQLCILQVACLIDLKTIYALKNSLY